MQALLPAFLPCHRATAQEAALAKGLRKSARGQAGAHAPHSSLREAQGHHLPCTC